MLIYRKVCNKLTETEKMKYKQKCAVAIGLSVLFLSLASESASIINRPPRFRRFHTRPMNRDRNQTGFYASLFKDMKTKEWDTEMYFKYTRMTPGLFGYLLELVGPKLQKDKTKNPLSPEHRLLITIHYLAEGCSLQEISWGYRIGKSTAHQIVKETCSIIWDVLSPLILPEPTEEDWNNYRNGFFNKWNLPNCIGAVDGKHVQIISPQKSGSEYFNYKKHFSIVIMATCGPDYRFTMVDVGAAGSNHDSAVFKSSPFGEAILNGNLNIPNPKNLPNTNTTTNCYFCGDSAFPLHDNIIRPYAGDNLGEKKNIFNYRLSRARRTIENTFGIWSQRWRILRKPIVASVWMCERKVLATVALHNFLQIKSSELPESERNYCPTGYADTVDDDGNLHLGTWRDQAVPLNSVGKLASNNATLRAKKQRDVLADYFVSPPGWVPWQENYVLRGSLPN